MQASDAFGITTDVTCVMSAPEALLVTVTSQQIVSLLINIACQTQRSKLPCLLQSGTRSWIYSLACIASQSECEHQVGT